MTVSFVVQKLFGFMRSHLIVEFSACIKAVLFVTLFLGQELLSLLSGSVYLVLCRGL